MLFNPDACMNSSSQVVFLPIVALNSLKLNPKLIGSTYVKQEGMRYNFAKNRIICKKG